MLALLLVQLAFATTTSALDIEFQGRAVRRDVLALYDGKSEGLPHDTRLHKFAEMPLNHLGLRLTYVDVNGPLPSSQELARYRGIVTWFIEPMAYAGRYLDWLDTATAAGVRVAVLSELAPPVPRSHETVARRVLERIGLNTSEHYVTDTREVKVAVNDRAMIGFERGLDAVFPDFQVFEPIPGRARVHLGVTVPIRGNVNSAALVITSMAGGYVADELSVYFEQNTDKLRWIINPFQFFKLALGEDRFPIPDVTTLAGRRIYFSHIDGDGWNNLSEIEQFRTERLSSVEVIAREAIEPYPDLPVTVGLIAGDIDPSLGGRPENAAVARRLFALPQVEVGSHTFTHPFNWSFFETYNRAAEQAMIDRVELPSVPLLARLRQGVTQLAGRATGGGPASNRYIAGSSDLPRSYLTKPFDLSTEIAGSLRAAEALAPPGKRAKLYQWSGDTTPFEAAIAAVRLAGARNINGGDSRLDKEYPSVFYVPPISRPVGKERQIYAVNSNENTYTNDWTGPYYGFFMLEHTLANTEAPRRLKPFNLYYHMYSGEKPAALASIKHFLDMARTTPVIPLDASHYVAIADDFFAAEVRQTDLFAWSIENRGELQTVRFDDAEAIEIDEQASRGVLGTTRKDGSLYVALDKALARAVVVVRPRSETRFSAASRPRLSLVSSRWQVFDRNEQACGHSFKAQGYGPGDMMWQTAPSQSFAIRVVGSAGLISQTIATADSAGHLAVSLSPTMNQVVDVRFDCHG
jgi:hypothetical protein